MALSPQHKTIVVAKAVRVYQRVTQQNPVTGTGETSTRLVLYAPAVVLIVCRVHQQFFSRKRQVDAVAFEVPLPHASLSHHAHTAFAIIDFRFKFHLVGIRRVREVEDKYISLSYPPHGELSDVRSCLPPISGVRGSAGRL